MTRLRTLNGAADERRAVPLVICESTQHHTHTQPLIYRFGELNTQMGGAVAFAVRLFCVASERSHAQRMHASSAMFSRPPVQRNRAEIERAA